MLKRVIFLFVFSFSLAYSHAQISISPTGDNPDESAMLDVSSTEKGMLTPRMTSTQRTSINNPAQGLLVYDTDTSTFWYFDNGQWNEIKTDASITDVNDIISNPPTSTSLPCANDVILNKIGNTLPGISVYRMEVVNNYAYVLDQVSEELKIIDISDPSSPSQVGSYSISYPMSIAVKGNFAYIGNFNATFTILNISIPSSPSFVSELNGSGHIEAIAIEGNYAFISRATFTNIIDISDPSNPVEDNGFLTFIDSQITKIEVRGDYYFLVTGSGTFEVIDIDEQLNGTNTAAIVADLNIGQSCNDFEIVGDYVYVPDISSNKIWIIDISSPTNPIVSGNIELNGSISSVESEGDYLFAVDYVNEEVNVLDISSRTEPILLTQYPIDFIVVDFSLADGVIYASPYNLLNAANPWTAPFTVLDITCSMNLGYNPATGEIIGVEPAAEIDGDITNEIQDLNLANDVLTITNNANATSIDLSVYSDTDTQLTEAEVDAYTSNNGYLTAETDGDITNEIQDLDLTNDVLTITNNANATSIDLSVYSDTDTQLTEAEVDAYTSNNGYLTAETDGDITNEIQDLDLTNDVLTITNNVNPTNIDLSPYVNEAEVDGDITNEIQDLELTDDILTITNNTNATSIDLSPYSNDLITSNLLSSTSLPCSDDLQLDVTGDFNMSNNPRAPLRVGNNVFVLDPGASQLRVVDVSDSENSVEIGSLGIGDAPTDMFINGDYAYIVDSDSDDLKVVNISTPTSPTLEGSIALTGAVIPFSIVINGNYAYITDLSSSGNLNIVDVSTPASPIETATLAIGGSSRGVAVSGNYAYVVDNGTDKIHVIDVSNPALPSTISLFSLDLSPNGIFIQDSYAYVIDTSSDDLKVIDISTPSNLTTVGTVNVSNTPTDIFVSESYAYIVDANNNSLRIYDITDPTAPFFVNSVNVGTFPTNVSTFGNYIYVCSATSDDMRIVEMACPGILNFDLDNDVLSISNNVHTTNIDLSQYDNSVEVDGDITNEIQDLDLTDDILTITNNTAATEIDLSPYLDQTPPFSDDLLNSSSDILDNPDYSCKEVTESFPLTNMKEVIFTEDGSTLLALAGGSLWIYDLTNPSHPTLSSTLSTGGFDMQVQGSYVYIQAGGTLKVIDITDPYTPSITGTISLGGSYYRGVSVSGSYASVAKEDGQVFVIDISDPSSLVNVGSINVAPDILEDIEMEGDHIFATSLYSKVMYVIDITSPSNPTLVNTMNLTYPRKIEMDNGYLYIMNVSTIEKYDISTPALPSLTVTYLTSTPESFDVNGNYFSTVYYGAGPEIRVRFSDMTGENGNFLVLDDNIDANIVFSGSSSGRVVTNATHIYYLNPIDGNLEVIQLVCGDVVQLGYNPWSGQVESMDFSEVDGDVTNEIQDLDLTNDILSITNNANPTSIDLSIYTDTQLTEAEVDAYANNNGYLTSETDGDITNEIQDLDLTGNILSITNNTNATDINLSSYLDADDLGSHTATQNIQLSGNWLSNDGGSEGIRVTNDGRVGVNTIPEADKQLHVLGDTKLAGNLNYTDGNQANGYVLTSDGNGNASWQNKIPAVYYSEAEASATYDDSDTWRAVTTPLTFPYFGGDVLKIEANGVMRTTEGLYLDPFQIRVKVDYQLCGTEYTKQVQFEPNHEGDSHNKYRLQHYLDMFVTGCGSGAASNITLTLQIRNTGDDPWQTQDITFVVTNLH